MKKILLIEDDVLVRDDAKEIMELSNYCVIVADNGKTGIAKAITERPDLIVCNIGLPILDGYGVLYAIQKNEFTKTNETAWENLVRAARGIIAQDERKRR